VSTGNGDIPAGADRSGNNQQDKDLDKLQQGHITLGQQGQIIGGDQAIKDLLLIIQLQVFPPSNLTLSSPAYLQVTTFSEAQG
jgi:hypothetical protein